MVTNLETADYGKEKEVVEVTALEQIFQPHLIEPYTRVLAHRTALPRARLICTDKVEEIKKEWIDGGANMFAGVYAYARPLVYTTAGGDTCSVRLYVREVIDSTEDIDSRSMIGVYVDSEVYEGPVLELRPDKLFRNGVGAHTRPDHVEDLRSLFGVMELYDGIEVSVSSTEIVV